MSHPVGQKLRCDDCGAEIIFTKPCTCTPTDPPAHRDICCGKDMRVIAPDTRSSAVSSRPGA